VVMPDMANRRIAAGHAKRSSMMMPIAESAKHVGGGHSNAKEKINPFFVA
jgi:hypothetical protein